MKGLLLGLPLGLPEGVTEHAPQVDGMIEVIHWFMLLLFVGWGAVYIYSLVRFRAGSNPRADYYGLKSKFPKYVEAGVVVFEAFLLFAFAFPLWGQWVQNYPSTKESVPVRVIGKQFKWYFHYAGADGKFGPTNPDKVDDENPVGLDRSIDAGKDDVWSPVLHLPVNETALAMITSLDVIHSFKVVAFRVTQDATPGLAIPIKFKPIKTGTYEIQCAQLCGIGHSAMKGTVIVEDRAEFDKWMAGEAEAQKPGAGGDDFWS